MKRYIKASESKSANWYIKTFVPGSAEYRNLEAVATLLNFATNSDNYYVETIYYDYDQDWEWTTISKKDNRFKTIDAVQALNPKLQEQVLSATTIDEIAKAAKDVLNH